MKRETLLIDSFRMSIKRVPAYLLGQLYLDALLLLIPPLWPTSQPDGCEQTRRNSQNNSPLPGVCRRHGHGYGHRDNNKENTSGGFAKRLGNEPC